jgi:signal transduction histidine kinase
VLQERQRGVGRRATDLFHPGQAAVVCEVADSGCGIPPESLTKIFEPFFTTKPAGEGTGLGLAITRSIIERHRGLIDVESRVGFGTTIRIVLPIPEPVDG